MKFAPFLINIAKKYSCFVLFLHHTGKNVENKTPSKNNILGSQGFEGKMRIVLELRKDKFDNSIRHLCIVKGNYLGNEMKDKSFKLLFDKNLLFQNTGEREDFDTIAITDKDSQTKRQIKEFVINLHKQNFSYRKIADKVGIELKQSISHTQVKRIIDEL